MAATDHDVLIIGSGASGGMAANILTGMGIKCLMLEAGPALDRSTARELRSASSLPYRGMGTPGKVPHVFQANEFNENQWVDEQEVPYTHDPDKPYNWVRIRMVGGKSSFWARMSYRLSDYEFKAASHDGFGDDWPIDHATLAPYYDRVEPILRVAGRSENFAQLPGGNFVEDDSGWSEVAQRVVDAANTRGIPITKGRRALGQSGLASSVNLTLPDAIATGNLTIVPNAVVREITTDPNTGRANGAHFVERQSGREMHATARVVILAASCLESTRILLNSGIANSSGVLGRYLIDQFYITQAVSASVPEARDGRAPQGFIGGGGIAPRFRNIDTRHPDFIRGYAYDWGTGGSPNAAHIPAYGAELEQALESYRGSGISVTIMGSVLPRYENHVRLNSEVTDAWGIPVLHVDTTYTDNEFNMARDAVDTFEELCLDSGAEIISKHDEMFPPGYSIHEVGSCRMGDDARTSVLNQWNQSHDINNLFVVDGSSFVTAGWQNPTLTIMALSMRASEYIAEQMRTGEI
jgi:choline dehydrogenase-like flavoprotein